MAALHVLTPTPPTVKGRQKLAQAAINIGGHVVGLSIHTSAAVASMETLLADLHPIAAAEDCESDRDAYLAALNKGKDGDGDKVLLALDQIRQAADEVEIILAKLRKLENTVLGGAA